MMSRLAGAFYFDGRAVMADDYAEACKILNVQEPHAIRDHVEPGLAMFAAGYSDGNHADSEPCLVKRAGYVCAWDGRLDNRDDVAGRLTANATKDSSDAGLALATYMARGTAGLGDLVGDWSLAIWDPRTRALLLASDYAGIRPLYYCRQPHRILWSSSLAALRDWSKEDQLDEQYIGDFLTRGLTPRRTPFRNISPVPAGEFVRAAKSRIDSGAFWSLPTGKSIRYANEGEYEERLTELFQESVQARVRTTRPVCAELSGGLDSSSVVCMTDRVLRAGQAEAGKLVTFSYRYPGSPDEKFFRAVEQFRGVSGLHIDMQAHPLVGEASPGEGAPMFWGSRFAEIGRRMESVASNVFLTGQLGDLIMGNWFDDSEQVADHIARGRVVSAAREAFAWSQALRVPVYPILWRALRANFHRWHPLENSDLCPQAEDSLRPGFRKVLEPSAPGNRKAAWTGASPGRRKHFWAVSEVLEARELQCPESLCHVSYSHPFAHRPLVEFMLTIPAAVVCRPGEPRRLMRRAFHRLLPETILKRRSKATYDGAFIHALRPLADGMLRSVDRMQLVELGYVDRNSAATRLGRLLNGLDCNEPQLRRVILLELWLRQQRQRSSSALKEACA